MALPREVQNLIKKQSGRIIRDSVEKRILLSFNNLKRQMISEFANHPISQEILIGPDAPNLSGTLNGYGNLFSYIGFYAGDRPLDPIVKILEKTTITFSRFIDDGAVWNIFMPVKEDIWEVTPMPWAPGRSWAKGIETGISGVGYYLYLEKDIPQSRSEAAIQLKNKVRSKARFKNTKYISEILAKYEKLFSQLDETAIST
jgi:hypothetical protein